MYAGHQYGFKEGVYILHNKNCSKHGTCIKLTLFIDTYITVNKN